MSTSAISKAPLASFSQPFSPSSHSSTCKVNWPSLPGEGGEFGGLWYRLVAGGGELPATLAIEEISMRSADRWKTSSSITSSEQSARSSIGIGAASLLSMREVLAREEETWSIWRDGALRLSGGKGADALYARLGGDDSGSAIVTVQPQVAVLGPRDGSGNPRIMKSPTR